MDLNRIEEAASRHAGDIDWPGAAIAYEAHVTPQVVLDLIALIRKQEAELKEARLQAISDFGQMQDAAQANAGPSPGDMPMDRFIAALPLPMYPATPTIKESLTVAPATADELRNKLMYAAIDCGHSISDHEVALYRDNGKEGNALHQLAERLITAALAAPQQHAQAALSDEQIDAVWESMPGGPIAWLRNFGYQQFARAILAASQPAPWESFEVDKTGDEHFDASNFLLNVAQEWWEASKRANVHGAVKWLDSEEGALLIYTRGEYKDALLENIHKLGQKPVAFAAPVASTPAVAAPDYSPLFTRIDEAIENYVRHGAICEFEGQSMIYAATLLEIGNLLGEVAPNKEVAQQPASVPVAAAVQQIKMRAAGVYITSHPKIGGGQRWALHSSHSYMRALTDFEEELVECIIAAQQSPAPAEPLSQPAAAGNAGAGKLPPLPSKTYLGGDEAFGDVITGYTEESMYDFYQQGRAAGIEEAAKLIEQHQETIIVNGADGATNERTTGPRKAHNLMGLAYATAIRALNK